MLRSDKKNICLICCYYFCRFGSQCGSRLLGRASAHTVCLSLSLRTPFHTMPTQHTAALLAIRVREAGTLELKMAPLLWLAIPYALRRHTHTRTHDARAFGPATHHSDISHFYFPRPRTKFLFNFLFHFTVFSAHTAAPGSSISYRSLFHTRFFLVSFCISLVCNFFTYSFRLL